MKGLIPLREAIAQLVQSVTTPLPLNGGAVAGGIGGVLAAIFGVGAGRLWITVLVVMLVDLTAGLLRTLVTPGGQVKGSVFLGGFLGKLLLLLLIPAAGAVDEAASMIPAIRDVMEGLPATSAVLVALIIREVASIVENVRAAKGDLPLFSILTRAVGAGRTPGGEA